LKAEEQVAKLEDLAQITTELKKLGSSQHELGEKTQQAIKEMIDGQIAAANKIRTKRVLDSLVYENMADRDKSIEDSLFAIQSGSGERRNAFELIFGDWENETGQELDHEEATDVKKASGRFLGWLSSPDGGIFHIAGKPGSGKSTLMKFLFDHERTREELTNWAGKYASLPHSLTNWLFADYPGIIRARATQQSTHYGQFLLFCHHWETPRAVRRPPTHSPLSDTP